MCLDCGLYGQSNPSLPDPVLAWNTQMLDAIRGDNSPPTLATRNLAILHTSIYDAVNCVQGTHQTYRIALTVPEGTFAPAAGIAAGYEVWRGFILRSHTGRRLFGPNGNAAVTAE